MVALDEACLVVAAMSALGCRIDSLLSLPVLLRLPETCSSSEDSPMRLVSVEDGGGSSHAVENSAGMEFSLTGVFSRREAGAVASSDGTGSILMRSVEQK